MLWVLKYDDFKKQCKKETKITQLDDEFKLAEPALKSNSTKKKRPAWSLLSRVVLMLKLLVAAEKA